MDLGAMAMKRYFTFHKAATLLEFRRQIVYSRTLAGGAITPLQKYSQSILHPQSTGQVRVRVKIILQTHLWVYERWTYCTYRRVNIISKLWI